MKQIVRIKFGSHLYGTDTPNSDEDWKSVHIPDADDILLQRIPNSAKVSGREKSQEGEKNLPTDVDEESYSLQRYLSLLADGQTVAIDMLFAPLLFAQYCYDGWVRLNGIERHIWTYIKENKDKLLSKRSTAFVGYCFTQASKYGIKGSRVAAARETANFFGTKYEKNTTAKVGEFCDPLAFQGELLTLIGDDKEHTRIFLGGNAERPEWMFECCDRAVPFGAPVKQAYEIYSKLFANYGERARMAETNQGIDWKALSHAVRVATEAIELFSTGRITFPLVNKERLLQIKKGELPYKEVAEEIENLLVDVKKSSETSDLREKPDYKFIDELVKEVYKGEVFGN